jgi:hypothetical protein
MNVCNKGDFDCWKRVMHIDHKGMVEPNEYLLISGRLIMGVSFYCLSLSKRGKKKILFHVRNNPFKRGKKSPLSLFPTQKKLF